MKRNILWAFLSMLLVVACADSAPSDDTSLGDEIQLSATQPTFIFFYTDG